MLYRVLEMIGKGRIAHTMRLRGGDIGAVRIGNGSVHGRRLEGRCSGNLTSERSWSLGRLSSREYILRRTVSRATGVGSKTRLTLLNLALDATSIRSLADGRQDWAHALDEVDTQVWRGELKGSLDDIVAIGVAHHLLKLLGIHELLDHNTLCGHVGATDALLDDIGAELLTRKFGDLASKAKTQWVGKTRFVQVEDVLDNVIAEGILDQMEAIRGDLADKLDLLETGSVVDTALKNAAAVTMSADGDAVLTYGIENKLSILRFEVVQALLNDMIAVQILDKLDNLVGESFDDHVDLLEC